MFLYPLIKHSIEFCGIVILLGGYYHSYFAVSSRKSCTPYPQPQKEYLWTSCKTTPTGQLLALQWTQRSFRSVSANSPCQQQLKVTAKVHPALHFGPGAPKISQLVELSPKLRLTGPFSNLENPQSQRQPPPLKYQRTTRAPNPARITFAHAHLRPQSRERRRFTRSPYTRGPFSTSAPEGLGQPPPRRSEVTRQETPERGPDPPSGRRERKTNSRPRRHGGWQRPEAPDKHCVRASRRGGRRASTLRTPPILAVPRPPFTSLCCFLGYWSWEVPAFLPTAFMATKAARAQTERPLVPPPPWWGGLGRGKPVRDTLVPLT